MPDHIDITIVIPVYQQWSLAKQLFQCLQRQTLDPSRWEVLAVDNGSDILPEPGQLPAFVRLLHCDTPGSYAARNVAIRYARGDLLIFTDADCQPEANWLQVHWDAYQRHGKAPIHAGAVIVKKLSRGVPNRYECYDSLLGISQKRYVQKRSFGVTANLAVPRVVFELAGVFDAKRFSGGDAEFCRRALRHGARLAYLAEARVEHPARDSWEALATKARRIKAAQVLHGSWRWRVINVMRAFLPPYRTICVVMRAPLSARIKCQLLAIAFKLRGVEIREIIRLLWGAAPERA